MENISCEENIRKLSAVVSELEKGDIPLEKAAQLYSEGVKLSAVCRKQLDEAKIMITEADADKASE